MARNSIHQEIEDSHFSSHLVLVKSSNAGTKDLLSLEKAKKQFSTAHLILHMEMVLLAQYQLDLL